MSRKRINRRPVEIVQHEPGSIQPLLGHEAIKHAVLNSTEDQTTLFRVARLVPPAFSLSSLEKILGRADQELQAVAELCGALAVPHTWGLYPCDGVYMQTPIPRHNALVAEVDIIDPSPDSLRLSERAIRSMQLINGVSTYNRGRGSGRWGLGDIRVEQFILDGINRNQPDRPSSSYLLDVDPIFLDTPIRTEELGTFPAWFGSADTLR